MNEIGILGKAAISLCILCLLYCIIMGIIKFAKDYKFRKKDDEVVKTIESLVPKIIDRIKNDDILSKTTWGGFRMHEIRSKYNNFINKTSRLIDSGEELYNDSVKMLEEITNDYDRINEKIPDVKWTVSYSDKMWRIRKDCGVTKFFVVCHIHVPIGAEYHETYCYSTDMKYNEKDELVGNVYSNEYGGSRYKVFDKYNYIIRPMGNMEFYSRFLHEHLKMSDLQTVKEYNDYKAYLIFLFKSLNNIL